MESKADQANALTKTEGCVPAGSFESTLTAKLANAIEAHRSGDLAAAEQCYRNALEMSPDHPHALHFMGVIEHQKGHNDTAIALIKRALDSVPDFADAHSNLGAAYYAQGDLTNAEASFRRAVELDPQMVDANSNLAAVLEEQGRWDEAATRYEAAVVAAPGKPKYLKLLGDILLKKGDFHTAIIWFEKYLEHAADDGEVSNNLGYACERLSNLKGAEEWYSKAVALCPDSPEINKNLATVLSRGGRQDEANVYFQRALENAPEKWAELANLAGAYVNRGEPSRAVPIYEQLVEIHPDDTKMWNDFGVATSASGHLTIAETYFRKAIELDPDFHEAYNNLGSNFLHRGLRDQAIEAFKKAIELSPRYLAPHINLCLVLGFADRLDEAYMYAQAVIMHEHYLPQMFSNPHKVFRAVCDFDSIESLGDTWANLERTNEGDFSANFLEMLVLADNEQKISNLVGLHHQWGSTLLAKLPGRKLDPVPAGSRSGKIKIGIMSADLREHSVAKFVLPLLRHYDREKFEFIAYAPFEKPQDVVQQEIKRELTAFKVTADMNEYEIAQLIREDEIDVLFELNGFTRDNRMKVFPYKAAPLQVFWLGYPFTTGIPEVDYVLLDPRITPEKEEWLIEKPLLMPESWVCFGEFEDEPISEQLPCERNGYVTFGSLNNPYKLSRKTIAQWCKVMNRVPESRFLYVRSECKSLVLRNNLINEFGSHGIGPERLHFVNNTGMPISHLSFYDEMDLSLDTFPLTGGTTTCDALWMGVPVVSKVGPGLHQRLSYSLLTSVGLEELCVETDEDYVEKAVALASDPESLRLLRRELRPVILDSALCRSEDYARNFCDLMIEIVQRHGVR
jgi:predicted O-linked N-acetylglucosamine transferase (SPINDLY family)